MKTAAFLWLFCSALYRTPSGQAGNMPDAMMRDAPSLSGELYRCESTAKLVNYLRGLGKEKALITLRDYARRGSRGGNVDHGERVLLLCRLLFVNPKGWKPPILGAESPAIRDGFERRFPLFPLTVTKGVPFYLVEGYILAGVPESPWACLDACGRLSLIPEDMSLTGYKAAALALVGSTDFKDLYPNPEDLRDMREMTLRQAGVRP